MSGASSQQVVLASPPEVKEAKLGPGRYGGLEPQGPGWFIVAAADASWARDDFGSCCTFEGARDSGAAFQQYGVNVTVVEPGQPSSMYHYEAYEDEAFLVLDGRCTAVVEGRVVAMSAGDVLWCPAGTPHVLVGAGDRPCAILMLGARGLVPDGASDDGAYVPDAMAANFDASVDARTSDPDIAYAGRPAAAPAPAAWTGPAGRAVRPGHRGAVLASAASPAEPTGELPPDNVRGDSDHLPWLVANVAALPWRESDLGWSIWLPAGAAAPWTQFGLNLVTTKPGRTTARYHREWYEDESFLVLDGTCLLLVEGAEHTLRAGDFAHLPAGTGHITVGLDEPCTIAMIGSRRTPEGEQFGDYPVHEPAMRWGGSVTEPTRDPKVAYADLDPSKVAPAAWVPT